MESVCLTRDALQEISSRVSRFAFSWLIGTRCGGNPFRGVRSHARALAYPS
jgi:hypothetical protein